MRKTYSFTILCSLVLGIALSGCQERRPEDILNDVKNIQMQMEKQENAWNEGNLEGFMDVYWKSDSLCFLSKNGKTCGWQKVYDNYQRSYPDQEAMGRLEFENDEIRNVGRLRYFVIGKWSLYRSQDTLSGYYSLIWMKQKGEWVIVFDHTS